MDDRKESYKGIDVETAFGDPESLDKAAAIVGSSPVCEETALHCNWYTDGRCTLEIPCPVQGGESATG